MANKSDFSVGQTVWHTARTWGIAPLSDGKITKVGRKYLTVDDRYQFFISDLREHTDIGEKGRLYRDKQEYEDEIELQENVRKLRKYFDFNSDATLEQTRQILEILGKGKHHS